MKRGGNRLKLWGCGGWLNCGCCWWGGKGPRKWGGPLHPERWLTLGTTPGWWLMLIVPWSFKLVIPIGVWLVVPGSISLAIPARVPTLLTPHALMAVVPGWTVGWSTLVVWVWGLLWWL